MVPLSVLTVTKSIPLLSPERSIWSILSLSSKTGFYFGVALNDVSIADKFEVQPELNFVAITDLNQLQAPIL